MSDGMSSSVVTMETSGRSSAPPAPKSASTRSMASPHDLVDRRHEVEAVLYEEQEHGEEHEEEDDLLDAGKDLAAVHALGDLDELQGEDEAEHAAADRQDGNLPYAPGDVVHGQVARAREHVREVGREDPVRADRPSTSV